ncbi:hypothetical protein RRG08_040674 [Elysia crispata]|uniref:Uncharacterized protein n=1 Tax=Elysia crispata TaxID=231223 RepID=A0AAE1D716_9GAST|nr:hypothetical protein RRG08_040674 [Elysia crispata]
MAFFSRGLCKKYCSIVGAHLAMAPLSFLWVYGNLSAYMESYFRFGCSSNCVDGNSEWILSMYVALGCPGILLTKLLAGKIGLKWTGVLGAAFLNIGLFGSAWTVQVSVAWTTVLLGVILGLAQGLTLTVIFQLVSAWAPERSALFMSSTTATATALSIVENQLITAIVNPENLKPDAFQDSRAFFSQQQVLSRVPTALIAYAGITLGLQFVGYLLISIPPKAPSQDLEEKNIDSNGPKKQMDTNHHITESKQTQVSETVTPNQDLQNYGSYNSFELTSNASNAVQDNCAPREASAQRPADTRPKSSEVVTNTGHKQKSLKPSEVLKTLVFYAILMYGIVTLYSLVLKANYYKQFALLYIHNDRYLTLVGTLIPIFASLSRISFGVLLNNNIISIKDAIIFSLSVNGILCFFWYFIPQVSSVLYMVYILCLATSQSLFYVITPAACMYVFGPAHFATNYGLVLSSLVIVGVLSPVVIPHLMYSLGWDWLFASSAILCVVALVFVTFSDFEITRSAGQP